MSERIKIANGWIIEIKPSEFTKGSYSIKVIKALFGHGIWFDVDLTKFTQEQWDMFHERIKEARNDCELDKHYQRMSEGFIPKEAKV